MQQAKKHGIKHVGRFENKKNNVFHCATERMRKETVVLVFVSVCSFIPPKDRSEYSVLNSQGFQSKHESHSE